MENLVVLVVVEVKILVVQLAAQVVLALLTKVSQEEIQLQMEHWRLLEVVVPVQSVQILALE
jgi:hypothetical protein